MRARNRWLLRAGAIAAAALIVLLAFATHRLIRIGAGHYVKTMCSGLFLSGRPADRLVDKEIAADLNGWLEEYVPEIDRGRGTVAATLFGLGRTKALYRPGLGCTIVAGTSEEALRAQPVPPAAGGGAGEPSLPWPEGERAELTPPPDDVDAQALRAAMRAAFDEPQPRRLRRTRAVVVVYKGRIVAESYGQEFTASTSMNGWGLAMGAVNALAGILVREGRLDLKAERLLPEWTRGSDARADITVEHLLRMTSGLRFDQSENSLFGDLREMYFLTGDMAAYAAAKPLDHAPGTRWAFSGGTTAILSKVLGNAAGGGMAEAFAFPRRALFAALGMTSAVLEPDAAGTLVGSNYLYATARDWARLGLLYLQDGVWNGRRILPEGWVRYTATPAPGSKGSFGAHFWLGVPDFMRPDAAQPVELPEGALYLFGFGGQLLVMIPSHRLVIFRSGIGRYRGSWDPAAFVHRFLKAFPAGPQS